MLCVLSGPEKGGIFSRAKNSKSERRSVTAITKMPIAFGSAANNDSSAAQPPKLPFQSRGSNVSDGWIPALGNRVSTVRYPIPQRTFKYVATVHSVTDETCHLRTFSHQPAAKKVPCE
jgi:hypothetical protein